MIANLAQISVLQTIAMVYALLAILRFQRRLTKYMEGRRAIMKLIAFKLFVAIQVLQRVSDLTI